MTTETQSAPVAERGERTMLTGKVTSAKMEKTIVVEVQRLVQHPKYRRVVRISKKFYAHDENPQAKTRDPLRIVAPLPHSKLEPVGTRVFGPVARELREKKFTKIVSLAPEVW